MTVFIDSCDAAAVELMYEALEAGAVPVMGCGSLEERLLGPHHHVLSLSRHLGPQDARKQGQQEQQGQHGEWQAASELDWVHHLSQTLGPQEELAAKRGACHKWWGQHRANLYERVHAAMMGSSSSSPSSSSSSSSSSSRATDAQGGTGAQQQRPGRQGAKSSTGAQSQGNGGEGGGRAGATSGEADARTPPTSRPVAPTHGTPARGNEGGAGGGQGTGAGGVTAAAAGVGGAGKRAKGGLSEWATGTLRITRHHPPPVAAHPPPGKNSEKVGL